MQDGSVFVVCGAVGRQCVGCTGNQGWELKVDNYGEFRGFYGLRRLCRGFDGLTEIGSVVLDCLRR